MKAAMDLKSVLNHLAIFLVFLVVTVSWADTDCSPTVAGGYFCDIDDIRNVRSITQKTGDSYSIEIE